MSIISVECICNGVNRGCPGCGGTNLVPKVACMRCSGTGFEAGTKSKCPDCRGFRYREIDQPQRIED